MAANILMNEKEKMIIETDDLTLATLVSEYLWTVKDVRFAGFVKEHPYLSKPKIVVNAANPRDAIISAGKKIIKNIEELKGQLKK